MKRFRHIIDLFLSLADAFFCSESGRLCFCADAFHLAWRALRKQYALCPIACASAGLFNTFSPGREWKEVARIQHDFEGNPLFVHKNGEKWGAASPNLPLVRRLKKVLSFKSKKEEEPAHFSSCYSTGMGYPHSFKDLSKSMRSKIMEAAIFFVGAWVHLKWNVPLR